MLEEKSIKSLIYEIRGKQVMIDSDLAKLYHVETRVFLQSIKRNIERFPSNFMFQLSDEEFKSLRSHFVISNRGGRRYYPYVFTEQGVAMLSGVLKSEIAIKTSIAIINAFVEMRKYISTNLMEQKYINDLVLEHDSEIKLLKETFSSFSEKNSHIFFDGQIYDAYSLLLDIFSKSKKEIIIIDNYVDKLLLDVLKNIDKRVVIISKNIDELLIKKYNVQYNNITFVNSGMFHDRFIIIDKSVLYHCGASFKDLGKKCFCISKIIEEDSLCNLLIKINNCL